MTATILGVEQDWYKVRLQPTGREGYIKHNYVVIEPEEVLPGSINKKVNVRSGPGTGHKRLGGLETGARVEVVGQQNGWYQVSSGLSGENATGWVRYDFVVVKVPEATGEAAVAATVRSAASANGGEAAAASASGDGQADGLKALQNKIDQTAGDAIMPFERRVDYAGYSKEFQPVKEEMCAGRLADAYGVVSKRDKSAMGVKNEEKMCEKLGVLGLLEHGSMMIDQGKNSEATRFFGFAENRVNESEDQSHLSEKSKKGISFLAKTVVGAGEAGEYPIKGFEKVLLLNYKTISYLIEGERKAYNVTRRAIEVQNAERKAFEAKLKKVQKELNKLDEEHKEKGKDSEPMGIEKIWGEEDESLEEKARTVSSVYVNPLADYIAGLVQEFDGHQDADLLDNARISYEKALELNPGSKTLIKAVKEMKARRMPAGKKLVHVVVADGLAPERKTLTYGFPIYNSVQAIKVPVYRPVAGNTGRIEVRTRKGKQLATLDDLADIEAITLRHDLDERPFQMLKVGTSLVRGVAEKSALQQFGWLGTVVGRGRDALCNPDMRAWMTLPSAFKVARFYVPIKTAKIELITYDKEKKRQAKQTISLVEKGPTFVYARSLNGYLAAYSSRKSWVASR